MQAPRGVLFLTHAGIEINVHLTCGIALFIFGIFPGAVILILVQGFWPVTQKSGAVWKAQLGDLQIIQLSLH